MNRVQYHRCIEKYCLKTAKGLKVSEIFNWFGGDFGGKEGVVKFVEKYQGSLNGNKITYFEYDWGLNGV